MQTCIPIPVIAACLLLVFSDFSAWSETAEGRGKALFEKHCASCHPSGGNIFNPRKTLQKGDMDDNKITTAWDILKVMRNPGPGMPKFGKKAMLEKDARLIADYILLEFRPIERGMR
ncbi:MAG TPA: c-type cytochrome [Dissulfurispiraceae bacterium]